MRVVHVMASGARGGGAEHLRGLVREQRALGVMPSAIVGDDGPLAEMLQAHVDSAVTMSLMRSRWDVRAPQRLRRAIEATRPDIVHVHGTRAAFFAGLTHTSCPSVYTVHGLAYRKPGLTLTRAIDRASEALACRRAARVITVAKADLDDLVRRHFVARNNVTHVPNAMDLTRFVPGDRILARQRMGVPSDSFVIATVARLVPQKAVADAIEAVSRVRDVTFVVIGDGPERAELRARASGRGVVARFLGARDDVPQLLAGADAFLLSSRWEGEPIALLEALAMGLPCIATATDGAREVLQGTGAGILVPLGDIKALSRALATVRREPEVRLRMASVARDVVRHRSFRENAACVLDVYRTVV